MYEVVLRLCRNTTSYQNNIPLSASERGKQGERLQSDRRNSTMQELKEQAETRCKRINELMVRL